MPVGRYEDIEHLLCLPEQGSIVERGPAELESRLHFMAAQVLAQWRGYTLIEEDTH
jgi:hypothetical protein